MNHDKKNMEILLNRLLATWENEVIEFKQAGSDYDTDKIGRYFSALSNEANLRGMKCAWLVFGIDNKSRTVTGSKFRLEPEHLQSIKLQINKDTEPNITFRNIFELEHKNGRVILFEIPAAPQGIPIAWKGHCYGRAGESIIPPGFTKTDEIRNQTLDTDWSAQIVSGMAEAHLDSEAVQQARLSFARKRSGRIQEDEVMHWPLATFLDRAKLSRDGALTRTALLLLGRPESVHLLSPHPAQITWKLTGQERAYHHFGPPFLLSTTQLYHKIRNIQIRILPEDTLIQMELSKYDQKIVLEALNNCIAHQDYTRNSRIVLTEYHDKLVFENEGSFFEGSPEEYITGEKTPLHYRNTFLVRAMTELNMIDAMGYGIHDMHIRQSKRYFPMPDYDLSTSSSVRMTLYGSILDKTYSRLLIQKTNLPILDIIALDRLQKGFPLNNDTIKRLRGQKLIEGHKPKIHISASIAQVASKKEDYIKTRAQDDDYYRKLILDYLKKFNQATRKEIDKLLLNKLSDVLNEKQKKTKINNLLTKLRKEGIITNISDSYKTSVWSIPKKIEKIIKK